MPSWLPRILFFFSALGSSVVGSALADEDLKTERSQESRPLSTFEADVKPILGAKCIRCHGETLQKADLALHTSDRIRKGGESGPIIEPGKSAESLLFEMIHSGEMPPDKKNPLTDVEVEIVRRWIDAGAQFGDETSRSQPEVTQHDILPILLLRCTACHGRTKREGELDLRSRAAMLKGGKSGPALVPGDPNQSLILKRIHAEEMPPRQMLVEAAVKPMEAEEVSKLEGWITIGAPEVATPVDLAGTADDPLVKATDRDFWSFQKPQLAAAGEVAGRDLLRTPTDAYVIEKLEAKGLTLNSEADQLTLLRRVSFDLTGLPPEPAEVQAFLTNQGADAYERLIDRLLASPRYGERWGRHWLDVAGYADCEGRREQHLPRPFAWRYRDYVIRSFNSDKSFDRFLLEQLAGDELADFEHASEITQELEDNLVATAFLRMSPDPTWANLTGFVPDRLEVMADVIDVLGSGVLGLTFKCARCHSHKFDPIPQRDYYRLVSLFKGAYDEHDWLKPEIISYGGALSAGLGDRYLPHISSDERQRWQERTAKLQSEIDMLKSAPQSPETDKRIKEFEAARLPDPKIMALWDRGEPSPTYMYRRGDYLSAGEPVQPGVPAVLSDSKTPFEIKPPWPGAISTGRRLAFARWLVQPENPLTARVMVNRVWRHHFGRGIVRSVGNFGKSGDRPSHPELLDWLALELLRNEWSLKSIHRSTMISSTYRQASIINARAEQHDPDNHLLSRMPLRRMEAEVLRDSLMLAAGQLDERRHGPADPVDVRADGLVLAGKRRSIYLQQLRKQPVSLLDSFDLPAMNPNCLQRAESLVAPQALHLLNDAGVRSLSREFASRIVREIGTDRKQQLQQMYWVALSRPPTAEELGACLQTLAKLTEQRMEQYPADTESARQEAGHLALATVCHTIMNSAMFLYID